MCLLNVLKCVCFHHFYYYIVTVTLTAFETRLEAKVSPWIFSTPGHHCVSWRYKKLIRHCTYGVQGGCSRFFLISYSQAEHTRGEMCVITNQFWNDLPSVEVKTFTAAFIDRFTFARWGNESDFGKTPLYAGDIFLLLFFLPRSALSSLSFLSSSASFRQ